MTVIVATARGESKDGIQALDARRHMRAVGELVASVFAGEMDNNGPWSPLVGGILSTGIFADMLTGYVWVEHGQLIGNVTLQRQEESGTRWRISNVAVAEPQRGRGIARALMQATIREIARRGGSWAMLQVRVDNPAARHLYEKLGFNDVCRDGVWHAGVFPSPLPAPDTGAALRPLQAGDWRARYELARDARAPLAHWAEPINPGAYRPGPIGALRRMIGEMTGLQRRRAWGIWQDDQVLLGDVEVVAQLGDTDGLCLAIRPGAPEGLARNLVAQGLQGLRTLHDATPAQVTAEYHGELAEPPRALEAAGFRPRRVLLTMRRLITPADADIRVPGLEY